MRVVELGLLAGVGVDELAIDEKLIGEADVHFIYVELHGSEL